MSDWQTGLRDGVSFIARIMPDLIDMAREIYEAFDGDEDGARAEIRDRREEIRRRRAENDQALRDKHD